MPVPYNKLDNIPVQKLITPGTDIPTSEEELVLFLNKETGYVKFIQEDQPEEPITNANVLIAWDLTSSATSQTLPENFSSFLNLRAWVFNTVTSKNSAEDLVIPVSAMTENLVFRRGNFDIVLRYNHTTRVVDFFDRADNIFATPYRILYLALEL